MVALEGRSVAFPAAPAERVEAELRRRFPAHGATVLVTRARGGEVSLVPAADPDAVAPPDEEALPIPITRGGVAGRDSALRALLEEGVRRGAAAVALVAAVPHDASADWLGTLLGPLLDGSADYVCPTYSRAATEGTLNTGIVYPLTRALYGWRLRQPLGGEAAVSARLARRLLDDRDWRRDPEHAGSDAWLVAKVLAGGHRAAQAWLGAWPHDAPDREDASHALSRVVGPVFREMQRHADRWQRVDGSEPVPSVGTPPPARAGDPARVQVGPLADAFRLGQRDLAQLWGLVLPPALMFDLRRAAAAPPDAFRIPDDVWARVVYDFAVAHFAKTMERRQLLASMTPIYLGWVASFVAEVRPLDAAAAEARVEALCGAFEREKPYLIAHWRWPEGFKP